MGKKRNSCSPQCKAKVALEALKNEQTAAQLSPNMACLLP